MDSSSDCEEDSFLPRSFSSHGSVASDESLSSSSSDGSIFCVPETPPSPSPPRRGPTAPRPRRGPTPPRPRRVPTPPLPLRVPTPPRPRRVPTPPRPRRAPTPPRPRRAPTSLRHGPITPRRVPSRRQPVTSTATESGLEAPFPDTSFSAITGASPLPLSEPKAHVEGDSRRTKTHVLQTTGSRKSDGSQFVNIGSVGTANSTLLPNPSRILVGAHVYVANNCARIFDVLIFALGVMGAEIVVDITDSLIPVITHVVSQQEKVMKLRSITTKNPRIHVVSPTWVWTCERERSWVSEASHRCENYDYLADVRNLHRRSSVPLFAKQPATRSRGIIESPALVCPPKKIPRLSRTPTQASSSLADVECNRADPELEFQSRGAPSNPGILNVSNKLEDVGLKNLNFMFASLPKSDKKDYESIIENLGGSFNDSPMFVSTLDFLIVGSLQRSEMILCSIVAGKYILHADYIIDSGKEGKLLKPEGYLWSEGDGSSQMEEHLAIGYAFWFKQIKKNPANKPFSKFRAVVFGVDGIKAEHNKDLIRAGGGKILDKESIASNEANIIICESKTILKRILGTNVLPRIVVKDRLSLISIVTECTICQDDYFVAR